MRESVWTNWLKNARKLLSARIPKRRAPLRLFPRCEPLEERVLLDDNSTGQRGIDARGLGFTGQGVFIGQVEHARPGLRGTVDLPFDSNANSHPDVNPDDVFFQDQPAVRNRDIDIHAIERSRCQERMALPGLRACGGA